MWTECASSGGVDEAQERVRVVRSPSGVLFHVFKVLVFNFHVFKFVGSTTEAGVVLDDFSARTVERIQFHHQLVTRRLLSLQSL